MESQESVEVVRAVWQRYAEGGLPAVMPLVDDDVTWVPHEGGGAPVHGRVELLTRGRELATAGIRLEAVGHRFEDHDGCVVVIGRLRVLEPHGHYDVPMSWQVDVVDGLITQVRAERRVEDARADCAA